MTQFLIIYCSLFGPAIAVATLFTIVEYAKFTKKNIAVLAVAFIVGGPIIWISGAALGVGLLVVFLLTGYVLDKGEAK